MTSPPQPAVCGSRQILDPEQLSNPEWQRRAARNEVVGPWAELGLAEDAIERLLHATVGELGASPSLAVEHAEFTHYGSGYASFVDVMITRQEGSQRTHRPNGYVTTHGLTLLLCRLAPIAAPATDAEHGRGPSGNAHRSVPNSASLAPLPVPDWEQESHAITAVLDRFGIVLLNPGVLRRPAHPDISVDTDLSGPGKGFDLFDVWFHWTD